MIYNNIKKLCMENNMSISQVEKEAGLGNGTISGWKESMPRLDNIQSVAKVLHTTVDALVSEPEAV